MILSTIGLAIWIVVLILTIVSIKYKIPLNSTTTICAIVCCILHYLEEILIKMN